MDGAGWGKGVRKKFLPGLIWVLRGTVLKELGGLGWLFCQFFAEKAYKLVWCALTGKTGEGMPRAAGLELVNGLLFCRFVGGSRSGRFVAADETRIEHGFRS